MSKTFKKDCGGIISEIREYDLFDTFGIEPIGNHLYLYGHILFDVTPDSNLTRKGEERYIPNVYVVKTIHKDRPNDSSWWAYGTNTLHVYRSSFKGYGNDVWHSVCELIEDGKWVDVLDKLVIDVYSSIDTIKKEKEQAILEATIEATKKRTAGFNELF